MNGQLAVSRAIGDVKHKEVVTAEAGVTVHKLPGASGFVVLACDGLWDFVEQSKVSI